MFSEKKKEVTEWTVEPKKSGLLQLSLFSLQAPTLLTSSNAVSLHVPSPLCTAWRPLHARQAQWDLPADLPARRTCHAAGNIEVLPGFAFLLYCHADFYGTWRNLITLKTPILFWTQVKSIMGSKVSENEGQNRWTDRWNECLCCCLRKQAKTTGISW